MEFVLKAAAAALAAAAIGLVIKKSNPELALLLSVTTVCVIMISASGILKGVMELRDTVKAIYGGKESFIAPVFKCLAISIVSKIACELCREASQNAAAAALEIAAAVCALTAAMPMMTSVLKLIGGMI